MKAISDKFLEACEDVALDGIKAMKAYLAYQGTNKEYLNKAKVGAAANMAYARHRASESNRMQVELVSRRMSELAATVALRLPGGDAPLSGAKRVG